MRGGKWMVYGVIGGYCVLTASGCVSLERYRRVQAANRNLAAEKESVSQELYDERHVNDNLRTRVDTTERELGTKNELLANLRGENELLDEMRRSAVGQLENMASRRLTDINIPKLPGPLDTAIKSFADQHPSEVVYDPSRGTVKWNADLLFPLGSDVVKDSSAEALRGFVEILKSSAATDFEVIVVGHTDNRPIQRPGTKEKHPTNWHLSAHRAIAVGSALQKYGYPPVRIAVMGCSEYRPVADNGSEAGQAQNRRVDLYIVPLGTVAAGTPETTARPIPPVKEPAKTTKESSRRTTTTTAGETSATAAPETP